MIYIAKKAPERRNLLKHFSRYLVLYAVFSVAGVFLLSATGYRGTSGSRFATDVFPALWLDLLLLASLFVGTMTFFLPAVAGTCVVLRGAACGVRLAYVSASSDISITHTAILWLTEILCGLLLCYACSFCRHASTYFFSKTHKTGKKPCTPFISGSIISFTLVITILSFLFACVHICKMLLWAHM